MYERLYLYTVLQAGIRTIEPQGKSPPWVRVGVWVKLTVRLELGATKQLPWRKIATRLGLGFGLGLVLGLAGEAMFLGGICPRTLQAIYSCFALRNYCELKKEKISEAVR